MTASEDRASLRAFISDARKSAVKPEKKTRKEWTEQEFRIALDMRLTGVEAAQLLGCSPHTVNRERREWVHEF